MADDLRHDIEAAEANLVLLRASGADQEDLAVAEARLAMLKNAANPPKPRAKRQSAATKRHPFDHDGDGKPGGSLPKKKPAAKPRRTPSTPTKKPATRKPAATRRKT